MKHPDYSYLDVAVNGPFNRRLINMKQADFKKLESKEDVYSTYFRYDQTMLEHYKTLRSVKGFKGKAWSDWLPVDVDSDNLEESHYYVKAIINKLSEAGINTKTCRYYFSGSKGFHVMIPTAYFTKEPDENIHKRMKKVIKHVVGDLKLDTAIYDKTRLFRLPNTKNTKSGLLKVELSLFEIENLSIREIQSLALVPREKQKIETKVYPIDDLVSIYHEPLTTMRNQQTKTKSKICLHTLMKGVEKGNRNNIALRVATHLKQSGLTSEMMWLSLNQWNSTNNPPLSEEELKTIHQQSITGDYEFGCFDSILKEHCDPTCLFYKKEWKRF